MKNATLLFAMGLISGCADYMNRYDSVTLAAGDSNKQNILLQTEDPLSPNRNNTHIEGDGRQAAAAVNGMRTDPATSPAVLLPPPPPVE